MRGIYRWPANSPHKGPVTGKKFSFDDVIIKIITVWLVTMFPYICATVIRVINSRYKIPKPKTRLCIRIRKIYWANQADHFSSPGTLDLVQLYNMMASSMETWKHFPRYWPFVRGIQWSPVNLPHKGESRGALIFPLIYAWINVWANNREADDLRCHRAHYDVTVM